ncbi:FecR family protein [Methylophilus sp. OH31]|uniref:FecR family protein n=1 Tax=Methylophilus sp. OH31 TaxID=1387312 RepID=UPI0004655999|nr:FecR domain-containing protein [Methylophilus sp. OH31]
MQKKTSTPAEFLNEDDAIAANRAQLQQLFPLPDEALYQAEKNTSALKRNVKKALPVLGFVFAVFSLLLWLNPAYKTETIASAIGEQKTLTLVDHSHLTLDTNTQLQVHWHLRSRQVVLTSGRVMFHVAHQAYRPFYVKAGATRIKVIGTIFDVLLQGDQATVTVLRGKVQVRRYHNAYTQYQEVYLTKDQQTQSYPARPLFVQTVDTKTQTAWKDGKIIFERTPLHQALAEMQRYETRPVVLADAQLANLKISGTFNTKSTDDVIKLLPQILPVKVIHHADGAIYIHTK